jgi:phosphatidylglycerol---prolipoprotein diacylglyceryl transferase
MVRSGDNGNGRAKKMLEFLGAALAYPVVDPIWFSIPLPFTDFSIPVRWYSLAYVAGILLGWWYLGRLIAQPGAPMARRHADDFVLWATLGIVLGGRLGYVLFYNLGYFLDHPMAILQLWDGGMSFHGGMLGVTAAILLFCRAHRLDWLRVHDYVACVVPFGLLFGRLANFINAELYGRTTQVAWGMVFPSDPSGSVRHPSQLYQAATEGLLLGLLLWFLFWRTCARHRRGELVGWFLLGYGAQRFLVEFTREPDAHLGLLSLGLSMGQWLCAAMIVVGLGFIVRARRAA